MRRAPGRVQERVRMRVLGFDTSGNACSAALVAEGRVVARAFEARAVGQAERLMPMIAEVLRAAALELAALDLIAVTLGPGAFTGVRIGIAAAQGLALASGRPALGLSSLECTAYSVPPALRAGRTVLAALDSRREELYLQAFDAALAPLAAAALVAPADWDRAAPPGALLLAGDGAPRLAAALGARDPAPALAPGD